MTPKEVLTRIRKVYPPLTLIGDSIEDVWQYGRMERSNPEAPGTEVFRISRTERSSGGAAAVWCNLDALVPHTWDSSRNFITNDRGDHSGAECRLCDERTGKIISPRISRHPTHILTYPRGSTHHKNVIISDYHRGMVWWEVLNWLAEHLRCSPVVFSPSIWMCRETMDPVLRRSIDPRILEDWVWVTNEAEEQSLHTSIRVTSGLERTHIITRGDKEVLVHQRGAGLTDIIHVTHVEAPHTSAIGDVFLAAISCAHFSDVDLIDAVKFANHCCEIVLRSRREGTHYLQLEDLGKL